MVAIVVMLAAGFAFLGAAVFIASGVPGLRRGLRTRSWPRAEGRVLRSAVVRETEATGEGTVDSYRAEVRYRYEAAGAGPAVLLAWGGACLLGGLLVLRVVCGLGAGVPVLVVWACREVALVAWG